MLKKGWACWSRPDDYVSRHSSQNITELTCQRLYSLYPRRKEGNQEDATGSISLRTHCASWVGQSCWQEVITCSLNTPAPTHCSLGLLVLLQKIAHLRNLACQQKPSKSSGNIAFICVPPFKPCISVFNCESQFTLMYLIRGKSEK